MMNEWVKFPTHSITAQSCTLLSAFRWVGDEKSDYIAALMVYIVLLHHTNSQTSSVNGKVGQASISYTKLSELTGISRTKISKGLSILEEYEMIQINREGKSNVYAITDYSKQSGWAKLPAKGLYDKNLSAVTAFSTFRLRSKYELYALKIYLVLVAFRDNKLNYSQLSYDKITEYAGVPRNDIRSSLSLLVANELIQIDSESTELNEYSSSNIYRMCHLEVYRHRGTTRDI